MNKTLLILLGAGLLGLGVGTTSVWTPITSMASSALKAQGPQRTFGLCHTGGGTNCVVDGDTVWMDGVKIRVADIDTPETHRPRCAEEAALGDKATERLRELLNEGPVVAEAADSRDEDRYGRKLRILTRDGQSLGSVLVSEGLARPWGGARRPWC